MNDTVLAALRVLEPSVSDAEWQAAATEAQVPPDEVVSDDPPSTFHGREHTSSLPTEAGPARPAKRIKAAVEDTEPQQMKRVAVLLAAAAEHGVALDSAFLLRILV